MSLIKNAFIILTAMYSVGLSAQSAPGEAEIRKKIETVLVDRHPQDTGDWWRALGPKAPDVIISMYQESSARYRRLRLMGALAWFPDHQRAVDFIKDEAFNTDFGALRRVAVKSLTISQGERALSELTEFLNHDDANTRALAAEALSKMQDPEAKRILEEYKKREKSSWILDKLHGRIPAIIPLKTVSSSEDDVDPNLPGNWEGFVMLPSKKENRLIPLPLKISFVKKAKREVEARISIPAQGVEEKSGGRSLASAETSHKQLKTSFGSKNSEIWGEFPKELLQGSLFPRDTSFTGQLTKVQGKWFLQLSAEKGAISASLRKQPAR